MALDVCFEAVGWLAQMFDSGAPDVARLVRRRGGTTVEESATELRSLPRVDRDDRRQRVRNAAAQLPADQAEAIWLVDVCGYRYAEAASTLGLTSGEVADLIDVGRRSIRAELEPIEVRQRVR